LVLDFPADNKVTDLNDEYLFGGSILVAPVVNSMYVTKKDGKTVEDFSTVKTRKVYLPTGTDWYDFWTGNKLKGGQEVDKESPIDIVPLYVKAGSILPWGPKVQYAAEKNWNNLEIRVYPGANGEFVLYEDENDNYNYEKGLNSTISMNWNEKTKTLTFGERKGSFNGMLKKRAFDIVLVNQQNGTGANPGVKFTKKITYTGNKISVKL